MCDMENITSGQVREAREWIADVWGAAFAKRLTKAEVIAGVQRHYDGGWAQFVADAG